MAVHERLLHLNILPGVKPDENVGLSDDDLTVFAATGIIDADIDDMCGVFLPPGGLNALLLLMHQIVISNNLVAYVHMIKPTKQHDRRKGYRLMVLANREEFRRMLSEEFVAVSERRAKKKGKRKQSVHQSTNRSRRQSAAKGIPTQRGDECELDIDEMRIGTLADLTSHLLRAAQMPPGTPCDPLEHLSLQYQLSPHVDGGSRANILHRRIADINPAAACISTYISGDHFVPPALGWRITLKGIALHHLFQQTTPDVEEIHPVVVNRVRRKYNRIQGTSAGETQDYDPLAESYIRASVPFNFDPRHDDIERMAAGNLADRKMCHTDSLEGSDDTVHSLRTTIGDIQYLLEEMRAHEDVDETEFIAERLESESALQADAEADLDAAQESVDTVRPAEDATTQEIIESRLFEKTRILESCRAEYHRISGLVMQLEAARSHPKGLQGLLYDTREKLYRIYRDGQKNEMALLESRALELLDVALEEGFDISEPRREGIRSVSELADAYIAKSAIEPMFKKPCTYVGNVWRLFILDVEYKLGLTDAGRALVMFVSGLSVLSSVDPLALNILMIGGPGIGKSVAQRAVTKLLPRHASMVLDTFTANGIPPEACECIVMMDEGSERITGEGSSSDATTGEATARLRHILTDGLDVRGRMIKKDDELVSARAVVRTRISMAVCANQANTGKALSSRFMCSFTQIPAHRRSRDGSTLSGAEASLPQAVVDARDRMLAQRHMEHHVFSYITSLRNAGLFPCVRVSNGMTYATRIVEAVIARGADIGSDPRRLNKIRTIVDALTLYTIANVMLDPKIFPADMPLVTRIMAYGRRLAYAPTEIVLMAVTLYLGNQAFDTLDHDVAMAIVASGELRRANYKEGDRRWSINRSAVTTAGIMRTINRPGVGTCAVDAALSRMRETLVPTAGESVTLIAFDKDNRSNRKISPEGLGAYVFADKTVASLAETAKKFGKSAEGYHSVPENQIVFADDLKMTRIVNMLESMPVASGSHQMLVKRETGNAIIAVHTSLSSKVRRSSSAVDRMMDAIRASYHRTTDRATVDTMLMRPGTNRLVSISTKPNPDIVLDTVNEFDYSRGEARAMRMPTNPRLCNNKIHMEPAEADRQALITDERLPDGPGECFTWESVTRAGLFGGPHIKTLADRKLVADHITDYGIFNKLH